MMLVSIKGLILTKINIFDLFWYNNSYKVNSITR
jgi:hypothetical protein